ncbi:MAG: tetratricopeptide repeat protein [Endomicrobiales bacterium]|nr:tetratricopeptide repeat protein [Endomicrobiales bacterium]
MKLLTMLYVAVFFLASCACLSCASQNDMQEIMFLLNSGRTSEAVAYLSAEVDKDPSNADKQIALGFACLQNNDYAQAQSHLNAGASLKPNSVASYYGLAMLAESRRDDYGAINNWRSVLNYSSDINLKHLAEKHIRYAERHIEHSERPR